MPTWRGARTRGSGSSRFRSRSRSPTSFACRVAVSQARAYTFRMAKFRGTVRRSDLEGGHWQLEAEDGETYVLEGATGPIESDGARGAIGAGGALVEVVGAVDEDALGIAMTCRILKVKGGKRL